jgi:NAD(P)-dependent dehydrogenase (short-subunit alcohol dehydrogenase family)
MNLQHLAGKVVVITGSSRGIGRAAAEDCAEAGAKVIVSSRNAESIACLVSALKMKGFPAAGFAADVSNAFDVESLFEKAKTEFGKIDVWINNAGISGGYLTLQSLKPADIEAVVNTNLMGTFYACRLLIPYFLAQGGGVIINLSGRGGKGNPSPYQSPYAATKAAVVSLTRSLAAENKGKPISINCLMPGMVATSLYDNPETCPETEGQMRILPVLLKSFGTPMERMQKVVVKMCAVKPGSVSGKIYSAERPERYFRALLNAPSFMRAMRSGR